MSTDHQSRHITQDIVRQWNENVVTLMTFPLLTAQEVVIQTTSPPTSWENFIKMVIVLCHCRESEWCHNEWKWLDCTTEAHKEKQKKYPSQLCQLDMPRDISLRNTIWQLKNRICHTLNSITKDTPHSTKLKLRPSQKNTTFKVIKS